jgi:hypothetical protein
MSGTTEKKLTHIDDLLSKDTKDIMKVFDAHDKHVDQYEGELNLNMSDKFDNMYMNIKKDFEKGKIGNNDLASKHKDKILDLVANRVLEDYIPYVSKATAGQAKKIMEDKKYSTKEKFEHVMEVLHREIGHNPRSRDATLMQNVLSMVDDKKAKVWELLQQGIKNTQAYTTKKTVNYYFERKITGDTAKYHQVAMQQAVEDRLKTRGVNIDDRLVYSQADAVLLHSAMRMVNKNEIDNKYFKEVGLSYEAPIIKDGVAKIGKEEYHSKKPGAAGGSSYSSKPGAAGGH